MCKQCTPVIKDGIPEGHSYFILFLLFHTLSDESLIYDSETSILGLLRHVIPSMSMLLELSSLDVIWYIDP